MVGSDQQRRTEVWLLCQCTQDLACLQGGLRWQLLLIQMLRLHQRADPILGSEEYIQSFVTDKVLQWVEELELASIAQTQPHAAHAAFTHGMTSRWTYLTHTMPSIGQILLPLEVIIRTKLIPSLTGRPPPNDTEWELLALPARLGGIALVNQAQTADTEFPSSCKITEALKEAIGQQDFQYSYEVVIHQLEAKS